MKTIIFSVLLVIIGCGESRQNGSTNKATETHVNDKTKTITEYFENGKIKSEKTFLDTIRDGPYKIWYQNGEICSTGQYKNGELTGICVEYDSLGRRHREILFIGDSLQQMIVYHKNGIIAHISFSKRRTMVGKFLFFYDNGMPKIIADSWNGTWTEYHKNGGKKLEYDFTTPKSKETKKFWNENGELVKEEFWVSEKLISTKEY
jgi:antitoxin component YwqK of YwqJK toxin-antitoxin module